MDGNENINHTNCIEGLISQVYEHLHKIVPGTAEQKLFRNQAVDDIDLFLKTTLKMLRKSCEGD